MELANALREILSDSWDDVYGITVSKIGVSSVKASEEDEAMIKELQRNATFRNPGMAAAHLVSAQAESMQSAAKNTSTGPMMAFAGMNMAAQNGGFNTQGLFNMAAGQGQQGNPAMADQAQQASGGPAKMAPLSGWTCSRGQEGKYRKLLLQLRKEETGGERILDLQLRTGEYRQFLAPTAERNARMPFGPAPADRKIKETSVRTAENRDSKKCKLPGCLLGQMGSLSQTQGERKWHL
ncbi:MAG: hypothetical protein ACLUAR_15845 [Pilosibacter sp.]